MYKGWCFRQQLLPCQRRVRNELLTPASYPDSSCVESLRQTRASQSAGGGLLGLHRPTSVRGQFVTSEVPILPLCGPSREDNAGCPTKVPSRCTRMGETRALTAAPATGHPRAPGGTSEGHTRPRLKVGGPRHENNHTRRGGDVSQGGLVRAIRHFPPRTSFTCFFVFFSPSADAFACTLGTLRWSFWATSFVVVLRKSSLRSLTSSFDQACPPLPFLRSAIAMLLLKIVNSCVNRHCVPSCGLHARSHCSWSYRHVNEQGGNAYPLCAFHGVTGRSVRLGQAQASESGQESRRTPDHWLCQDSAEQRQGDRSIDLCRASSDELLGSDRGR